MLSLDFLLVAPIVFVGSESPSTAPTINVGPPAQIRNGKAKP